MNVTKHRRAFGTESRSISTFRVQGQHKNIKEKIAEKEQNRRKSGDYWNGRFQDEARCKGRRTKETLKLELTFHSKSL
jgi:hypothetical protein